MLSILTAIIGFAGPFLPEVLKYFNRKADNAHELHMMQMRLQAGKEEHTWRMEEITAHADIAEATELHKPQSSFGIQILDKAHDSGMPPWATIPVFWTFSLVDMICALVRPGVTYTVVAGYLAYKAAVYSTLTGSRFGNDWAGAVTQIWSEQDYAVLTLVLAFWFGGRAAKAAFGGSASTAHVGR